MKQKLLLLLTALMLLTTGNAWGELTPVSQDYSSGIADWTSGNVGRYTVDMNAGGYLTVNAVGTGDNGATITGSTVSNKAAAGIDFASSDDFTMIFDLQLNGGNNQCSFFHINDAANGGGNESEDGHMLTLYQTAVNGTTWRINHLESQAVTLTKSTWYTFKLTKSASYLYLTVTPKAGGNPVFERQRITVKSAKGGLGNMIFQTKRWYSFMAIDNVVLRAVEAGDLPDVTYANYTVHFKDGNGATIKDDEVRNDEVDSEVGASDADKVAFIAGGCKYVYKTDGGGTTVTNDGAAEFTVTYDKYESTAYTVKAQVSGTDLTTLASGTTYFDGSTTVYWNKYINVNDQWYIADGTTYGKTITTATNNVAFTAVDDIDYFFEAENMTYSRTFNTYSGTAASNGSANTLYGDANAQTTSTVSRGKYNISISGIKWADNSDTYQIAYSTDRANWIALGTVTYATGTEGVRTLENVIIPAESYIRIWTTMGSQTPRRYLDYMILDRTQEYTDVEIAIIDCKRYETSDAFATAVAAESFSTAEEVYAFHTAWQIAKAKASGSTDITKVIRNAAIDGTGIDWANARIMSGQKYTEAPDDYYLDQYQATLDAYQTVYGLPAGSYKVKAATRGSAGASGNIYVYAAEQVDKNAAINLNGNTGGTLGQGWSWTEVEFTLTATSDVKIGFSCDASASEQWAGCDDFHLYAEGVPASLGTNGYATFASPYALDLANLPEGLTAYKASVSENTVTFTQVEVAVQPNTGLLLKGSASGNYDIPVAASGADISATNAFLVNEGGNTFNADDNYNYFGLKKNTLTFGLFNPATVAIPSNKAYLKIANSGARLTIVFEDDDPTAINTIEAAESEADALKDGKYLIGNKIILVKNGVKYSANGQILK